MFMHYLIKEIPMPERPRERMIKHGAEALSNAELLAILLRTGNHEESVIHLSQRVLIASEGLKRLKTMSYEELSAIKGIKQAKATVLLALIELAKRLSLPEERKEDVSNPRYVFHLLKEEMAAYEQEHFLALYVDTKCQLITKKTLFIGSLNKTIIHPREIFKHAVKSSAAGVIFVHNHPSGDPTPSPQDIMLTKQMMEVGKMMDIFVYDHIVLGKDRFCSMKERGHI